VQAGRILAALVAAVVGLALSGCGGSDNEADTAPPTVNTGAANKRLSAASWDTYVTSATQAQKVNQAAIKTFSKCRDLIARNMQSEQIQQCFDDSTSDVVTEGQKFMATLAGFDDEVAGACAKALTDYEGYVKLYVSSVNALDTGLQGSTNPPDATQVDQASGALARARAASKPFETNCKPTA
jgi:ABC-type glycerol-3-phosphate transport system substrate-binding protein